MATVIDALVVTLGLNAQNFTQGNREANQSLDRTRQNTKDVTKEEDKREKQQERTRKARNRDHIEQRKQQKESIDNFKEMTKQAVSFFGFATTFGGMASWIGGITQANSQLYRVSNNLGMGVGSLKKWGMAIEQTGGDAKSAVSTMQMISDTLTGLQLGIMPQNAAVFSMLKVDLNKAYNSAEPLVEVLKMINAEAQNIKEKKGIREAFNIVKMVIPDYDMANLLVKDPKELDAFLASVEKINKLDQKGAENSAKLAQQWVILKQKGEALGQTIEEKVTPKIFDFIKGLEKLVEENPKAVAAVGVLAGAFLLKFSPVRAILASVAGLLVADDWVTWANKGESQIGRLVAAAKQFWYTFNGAFDEKSKLALDIKHQDFWKRALNNINHIIYGGSTKSKVTYGENSSSSKKRDKHGNLVSARLIPNMTPSQLKADLLSKGWPEKEAQAEIDKIVKDVGLSKYGYINAKTNMPKFSASSNLSQEQVLQLQTNAAKLAANPSGYNNTQSSSTTTNSTNVGQVIINTQASDARGVYNEFVNRVLVNQAESGGF